MQHLPTVLLRVLLVIGLTLSVPSLLSASGAEQPGNRRVVITIKGMMCASCSHEIEKSLNKVAGVVMVTVDLSQDRATVIYDERKVTSRHLAEVIRKAGYEAILPNEAPTAPLPGR